jgi:hypothetical protein
MKVSYRAFATSPGDEIVISGIAGRFPKSANVAEFSDNLYNKVVILEVGFLGIELYCTANICK